MGSAIIIDGKARAERLRGEVRDDAARLLAGHGVRPGLAVVLVGDDAASAVYVRSKGEQSREAGFHSVTHRLGCRCRPRRRSRPWCARLNRDPAIHGILVQLPLPRGLDEQAVLNAHRSGQGRRRPDPGQRRPPRQRADGPRAVHAARVRDPAGGRAGRVCRARRAVVLGRSVLVGRPVAQLLLRADCTVTIAHSRTR